VLLISSTCVCRRGAVADWTAKNRDADLHVRDGSSSDRRATKRRPALQNDRAVCGTNDGAVNARYRLPALDKALCMLAALPALLLHLIIIGTHRRKNESQHSNERNQAHYGMASEMTATARSSQSSCAHIALEDALHGSIFQRKPGSVIRRSVVIRRLSLGVRKREETKCAQAFSNWPTFTPLHPHCQVVKNTEGSLHCGRLFEVMAHPFVLYPPHLCAIVGTIVLR